MRYKRFKVIEVKCECKISGWKLGPSRQAKRLRLGAAALSGWDCMTPVMCWQPDE